MIPVVVEWLLTLEKSPDAALVSLGGSQFDILAFPPNTTATFGMTPGDDYAHILFQGQFDTTIKPRAFYTYLQQYGNRLYDGVLTSTSILNPCPEFIVGTAGQPTFFYIQNRSNLVQYFSYIQFWLVVRLKEDMEIIRDALRRMHTSTKSEALAAQASNLLVQLMKAYGPRPLIVRT